MASGQDNAVKVFIRTRPTTKFADPNIKIDEDKGDIMITIPKKNEQGYVNHQQEHWAFKFDKIMRNVSQEILFGMTVKDMVLGSLDGYSGTLIAYGQTGAGKTFTILGYSIIMKDHWLISNTEDWFLERSLHYSTKFRIDMRSLSLWESPISKFIMKCSTTCSVLTKTTNLIKIWPFKKTHIMEFMWREHSCQRYWLLSQCHSEEEALGYLFEGETNRTISEHKLNKTSSRSHCLFTIHLETRSRVESSEKVVISKINLVDLAGSERTKKTGIEGQTVMEASFINKSLACLGQVVVALSEKE